MKNLLLIISLQFVVVTLKAQSACDSLQIFPVSSPQVVSICSGDSIELSVNLINCIYDWSTGESTSSIIVIPNQLETYYIKVFDGSVSCNSQVSINPEVVITPSISGNDIVIPNSIEPYSVTLNISSTYYWELSGGGTIINNSMSAVGILWGNIPGTYNLSVSEINGNGCIGNIQYLSITVAPSTSIIELEEQEKVTLLKVYDLLGNEIDKNSLNQIKIYMYSDGSFKKYIEARP